MRRKISSSQQLHFSQSCAEKSSSHLCWNCELEGSLHPGVRMASIGTSSCLASESDSCTHGMGMAQPGIPQGPSSTPFLHII